MSHVTKNRDKIQTYVLKGMQRLIVLKGIQSLIGGFNITCMNVLIMATIIASKWQNLNVVISNSAINNGNLKWMFAKRIASKNLLSKI